MKAKLLMIAALAGLIGLGAAQPAHAGAKQKAGKAHTNLRQYRQKTRIRRGVESGEITDGERKALKKEQRVVNRMEKRALSDGELTRDEKKKIQKAQNKASRDIYRAKHNDRKTGDDGASAE